MNPADVLKYGHQQVVRTLDGLDWQHWETSRVCGVWSVKDIIGHLAAYEHHLVEILADCAGFNQLMPYHQRMMEHGAMVFNDSEVAARQGKLPADILAEYQTTYAQVADLVGQISLETWRQPGTLPWYGNEYSLEDFIVYAYYGHKREHSAQIAVFHDTV